MLNTKDSLIIATQALCPCTSGLIYADCCQVLHEGAPAHTPEALMRSRYCAFVQKNSAYLLATWHLTTRPGRLGLSHTPDYCALKIVTTGSASDTGWVHFLAVHRHETGFGFLEERSDFLRENGRWFYVSGKTNEGVLQPTRNEPCPCGSGKKFKTCCL